MTDERGLAEQIIDFLEEHEGEAFSAIELSKALEAFKNLVIDNLTRLRKSHEVNFERVSCKIARKIYKDFNIKRGMNLYFLDK